MAENKTDTSAVQTKKLHNLLGDMAEGMDKLYACLRDQQKALMGWKLADFVETVKRQRRLARENLGREDERRALVRKLAGGQNAANRSLRDLAEMFGGRWPKKFQAVADKIKSSSARVAEMKKQNEALITRSRDLVDGQLRLMINLASLNRNTYEQSGRKTGRGSTHKVLDQKA
ncbi:MAG: hypothetical protein FVQ81_10135 [Candidatus Glassbacteria bacterium]|nr:hypothetical protein [Candidatus Glassbacteria bacterium]